MNELTKIKDVSARYEVTARTLHYYEKMGLITSSRDIDSNHRLYDQVALSRLKQILILRKMNISIRDIKEIFDAQNSDTVLSVLDRKVDDIDSEVALLHELKEIVLEFIKQIKQADFHNEDHVKLLYDKAMEIETSLSKESDSIGHLFDTSDKLDDSLESITVKIEDKPTQTAPEKEKRFEIRKHSAYRFIGCSVYCRFNWGHPHHPIIDIISSAWKAKEWVYSTLDAMTEYQTDMPYGSGLYIMDRYEDTPGREMQGYIIGKFMKADTPVPDGMDWIEVPAGHFALGWNCEENYVYEATREAGYTPMTWFIHGEIYPKKIETEYPNHTDYGGYLVECYKQGAGPLFVDTGIENRVNTQILIVLDADKYEKSYFDKVSDPETTMNFTFTLEITPVGSGETQKVTLPVASNYQEWRLLRFEPCVAEGENRFIPEKNVKYDIVLEIRENSTGEAKHVSFEQPFWLNADAIV